MRFTFFLVAAAIFLASTLTSRADEPGGLVSSSVSKSSLQVAEPFELEIAADVPLGSVVYFPVIGDRLGEFEVIGLSDQPDLPHRNRDDLRTWSRKIRLETLATGSLEVPALEVSVVGPDRQSNLLRTKPHAVTVVSVLEDRVDPTAFRDIRDVVDLKVDAPSSLGWIGWPVAGVIVLACLAGVAIVRNRRKRWVTPAEWAKQELTELQTESDRDLSARQLLARLEGILRFYLENEFVFPATSYTADQMIDEVKGWGATESVCQKMKTLFQIAEEAKFADLKLGRSDVIARIQETQLVVDELQALVCVEKEAA